MTLDELERMAEGYKHLDDPADPYPAETVGQLARAVLAMVPVVRAAYAYRDAKDFDTYEATQLEESVDALRARLEAV